MTLGVTTSQLSNSPQISQISALNAIQSALFATNAHTQFDYVLFDSDDVSSTKFRVYETVFDGTKTFGKFYTHVSITSALAISVTYYQTWDVTANTGTGATAVQSWMTLDPTKTLEFISGTSDEMNITMFYQGTNHGYITRFRPLIQLDADENEACHICFLAPAIKTNNTKTIFVPLSKNLQTATSTAMNNSHIGDSSLSGPNLKSSKKTVIAGIQIYWHNATGIWDSLSEDIAAGSLSGTSFLATVSDGGKIYQSLSQNGSGTGLNGGLMIRIA